LKHFVVETLQRSCFLLKRFAAEQTAQRFNRVAPQLVQQMCNAHRLNKAVKQPVSTRDEAPSTKKLRFFLAQVKKWR